MTLSRRKMIMMIGGGAILAAGGAAGYAITRRPQTAHAPWENPGDYSDPRMAALSWALLAPNPHNRQPWLVDLSQNDTVTLFADPNRRLPHTDPYDRQITIGLGCFLELLRMAAAEAGYRTTQTLFPQDSDPEQIDARPVAQITFTADTTAQRDPLFAYVHDRRSNKEPFDTTRTVDANAIRQLGRATRLQTGFGGTIDMDDIAELRKLTHEALRREIETPRTHQESVDLFRIGHAEVDANPDGIDFTGPMFEALRLTGQFNREVAADTSHFAYRSGVDAVLANTDTAMGHVWLVTADNSRESQIAVGADWLRVNLAAAGLGLGFQPLSQALQEYPEVEEYYRAIHARLAPQGSTVQMLARIGYGVQVGKSPRWPLENRIMHV